MFTNLFYISTALLLGIIILSYYLYKIKHLSSFYKTTIIILTIPVLFSFFFSLYYGPVRENLFVHYPEYIEFSKKNLTELGKLVSKIEPYNYQILYKNESGTGYLGNLRNGGQFTINDNQLLNLLENNNIHSLQVVGSVVIISFQGKNDYLGYSPNGFVKSDLSKILAFGKITKILDNNWVFLERCSRNNCNELDK